MLNVFLLSFFYIFLHYALSRCFEFAWDLKNDNDDLVVVDGGVKVAETSQFEKGGSVEMVAYGAEDGSVVLGDEEHATDKAADAPNSVKKRDRKTVNS